MKRKTRQIVSCILAFAMSLQGIGSSGVYAAAQTLQGTDGVAVASEETDALPTHTETDTAYWKGEIYKSYDSVNGYTAVAETTEQTFDAFSGEDNWGVWAGSGSSWSAANFTAGMDLTAYSDPVVKISGTSSVAISEALQFGNGTVEDPFGESSFYDVEEGEFSFVFSLSRTLDSGIGIAPGSEYITITSIEVYNRGTEATPDPSPFIDPDISASPGPTGSTEPTATPEPTVTVEPTPAPEIPGEGDMNSFWVISYLNGQNEYVEVTEDGTYQMSIIAAEACKPLQMFWLDTNLYRDKIAYGFKIKVTDISINGEEQTIDDSEGYQLFADCSYTQALRYNIINPWNQLVEEDGLTYQETESDYGVNIFGDRDIVVAAGDVFDVTFTISGMDSDAITMEDMYSPMEMNESREYTSKLPIYFSAEEAGGYEFRLQGEFEAEEAKQASISVYDNYGEEVGTYDLWDGVYEQSSGTYYFDQILPFYYSNANRKYNLVLDTENAFDWISKEFPLTITVSTSEHAGKRNGFVWMAGENTANGFALTDYAVITDYAGDIEDAIVPDTVGEYSVEVIGANVFGGSTGSDTTLESLTMGDSIRRIDSGAIVNCTKLSTVTIGKNIEKIAAGAFRGNTSLETVEINNGTCEITEESFDYTTDSSGNKEYSVTIRGYLGGALFTACEEYGIDFEVIGSIQQYYEAEEGSTSESWLYNGEGYHWNFTPSKDGTYQLTLYKDIDNMPYFQHGLGSYEATISVISEEGKTIEAVEINEKTYLMNLEKDTTYQVKVTLELSENFIGTIPSSILLRADIAREKGSILLEEKVDFEVGDSSVYAYYMPKESGAMDLELSVNFTNVLSPYSPMSVAVFVYEDSKWVEKKRDVLFGYLSDLEELGKIEINYPFFYEKDTLYRICFSSNGSMVQDDNPLKVKFSATDKVGSDEEFLYKTISYGGNTYIEIIDYIGENQDVVIPDTWNNIQVKSVNRIINNDTIETFTIPESVDCFYGFQDCTNLKELNLQGVIQGYQVPFISNCPNLTKITTSEDKRGIQIEEDLLYISGRTICYIGDKDKEEYILPDCIEEIYELSQTFEDCHFKKMILPSACGFIGVTLPSELKEIYIKNPSCTFLDDSFAYTEDEEGNTNYTVTVYGYAGGALEERCQELGIEFVALPTSYIDNQGVYYSLNPDDTCQIGYAEDGIPVTSLTTGDIVIPESIIVGDIEYTVTGIIGEYFKNHEELVSLELPSTIESIPTAPFEGCTSLESVTIAEENQVYSSDETGNIYNKDKTILYVAANGDSQVEVAETVSQIWEGAFSANVNLESVTIPANVTIIHTNAFTEEQKEQIIIVAEKGSYAEEFADEWNISKQIYNNSLATESPTPGTTKAPTSTQTSTPGSQNGVTNNTPKPSATVSPSASPDTSQKPSVGEYVTPEESSVAAVEILSDNSAALAIGNNVVSAVIDTVTVGEQKYEIWEIKKNAYRNKKKLKKITIGKSIKKIGANAFYGCKNLKKITFKSKEVPRIEKNAFKKIHKKAVFYVPKKSLKKYKKALKTKVGYKKSMKIVGK